MSLVSTFENAEVGSLVKRAVEAVSHELNDGGRAERLTEELLLPLIKHRPGGMVVGIQDGCRRAVLPFGKSGNPAQPLMQSQTIFQIGSISKPLCGTTLSRMALEGQVALSDRITDYFPSRTGSIGRLKDRTLLDLATHFGRLPCIPQEISRGGIENPYVNWSRERMYEYLSKLSRQQSPKVVDNLYPINYSNLGYSVLGDLLARKAAKPYEVLVSEKVLAPLGMTNTFIEPPAHAAGRLARAYDEITHEVVQDWQFDAFAPCGAFRSNADDLLNLMAANVGALKTPLKPAIELAQRTRIYSPNDEFVSLGWFGEIKDGREIFWHNGATRFFSYCAFTPHNRKGVVALSNSIPWSQYKHFKNAVFGLLERM